MDLYLVRHGQSQSNAGLTESLDSDLTELGRQQAELTAERLRSEGLTRAYVSPLRRTLQTITPICEASRLRAHLYPDVCEYFSNAGYRTFPGLHTEEILRQYPVAEVASDFPCEPMWWPGELENPERIFRRAVRVRDTLLSLLSRTDERVLIVSHAETIGRLIEAFLRVPPDPNEPPWSDNCGISRLTCSSDPDTAATLLFLDQTDHLPGMVT